MSDFISMKEAGEYLGVSQFTLRRVVRKYKLPTAKDPIDGRQKLVRKSDLDRIKSSVEIEEETSEPDQRLVLAGA